MSVGEPRACGHCGLVRHVHSAGMCRTCSKLSQRLRRDVRVGPPKPDGWQDRAACKDLDVNMFYPDDPYDVRSAYATCDACPVAVECAAWAIRHRETQGIWGGLSPGRRNVGLDGRGFDRDRADDVAPLLVAHTRDKRARRLKRERHERDLADVQRMREAG